MFSSFNYTNFAARIIADAAARVPALAHVRPGEVAVAASGRWAGSECGCLATCVGLGVDAPPAFTIWSRRSARRVEHVSPWFRRRSPEVVLEGVRRSYLVLFRLPRMLAHDPLETIMHELVHIGPRFDGRLRRARHGPAFDAATRHLMRQWIERGDPELVEAARWRMPELRRRRGTVVARCLPALFRPVLVEPAEPPCSYEEGLKRFYPGYEFAPGWSVRPIRFSSPRTPRRITDRDCAPRAYGEAGEGD